MHSETRTMGELREHLIEKATMDEAFRARLLSDPKAAIEEDAGPDAPGSREGFAEHSDYGAIIHQHGLVPSPLPQAHLRIGKLKYRDSFRLRNHT